MDAGTRQILDNLTIDMLEGTYKDLADEIGLESLIKLSSILGGSNVYIPKLETLLRPARDKAIKKEHNGYNTIELAKKYNLSERTIREIVNGSEIIGQISMFEL